MNKKNARIERLKLRLEKHRKRQLRVRFANEDGASQLMLPRGSREKRDGWHQKATGGEPCTTTSLRYRTSCAAGGTSRVPGSTSTPTRTRLDDQQRAGAPEYLHGRPIDAAHAASSPLIRQRNGLHDHTQRHRGQRHSLTLL